MTRKKKRKLKAAVTREGNSFPFELRLLVVREVLRGAAQVDTAVAFGLSSATVQKYIQLYRKGGVDALRPLVRKARKRAAKQPDPKRDAVVKTRQAHPEWGSRRIRDELERFAALGVSDTQVRRVLHEEGLATSPTPAAARDHAPRRFERAAPNQLWQSDIFTFLLRRHERLYLAGFMDDHSRFIVGHALAHHQKSGLVMEALGRGIGAYGTPRELLTDNGRQYTAWRGETEFEQELKRQGIAHFKSRPQHPQTLGKIERFWKTLWEEFLSRTVFADFADCARRLDLYVQHYNFRRPHQGIDGAVPADRYFRAADAVRTALEGQVADNALRLALQQPTQKPFYIVGRVGDRDLSIAASAEEVQVKLGDDTQTIRIKESADGTQASKRVTGAGGTTDEGTPGAPAARDAAMAAEAGGSGRDREAARAAGAERAVGREAGDDGGRGVGDLARLLLSAGDEGVERDALGLGAGGGRGGRAGRDGDESADRGPGAAGDAASAGEAARRAPPAADAQDDPARAGEDGGGPAAEAPQLDERWTRTLECLAEEADDAGATVGLDPDAGWRDRGPLKWERKLAGTDASSEDEGAEGVHDAQGLGLRTRAGDPPGIPGAVRGDDAGDVRRDRRDGGGAASEDLAGALPDADAPGAAGLCGGAGAPAGGPSREASAGGAAGSTADPPGAGERAAAGTSGDGEAAAGRSGAAPEECRPAARRTDSRDGESRDEGDERAGGPRPGQANDVAAIEAALAALVSRDLEGDD
jgi:transposase InsO family protein